MKYFQLQENENLILIGASLPYIELLNQEGESVNRFDLRKYEPIKRALDSLEVTVGEASRNTIPTIITDAQYKDGKLYKANADSSATMIVIGMATEGASVGDDVIILTEGWVRNSGFNFTVGGQASKSANSSIICVSDTANGEVSQIRPTASTHVAQILGYAIAEDIMNFKPDYTFVELC